MSDIRIISSKHMYDSKLFINGQFQTLVRSFSILWAVGQELPILEVNRWKPGPDGRPYTIGGGYVADLVEYYPVHSLVIE